jgi:hypothetical protein
MVGRVRLKRDVVDDDDRNGIETTCHENCKPTATAPNDITMRRDHYQTKRSPLPTKQDRHRQHRLDDRHRHRSAQHKSVTSRLEHLLVPSDEHVEHQLISLDKHVHHLAVPLRLFLNSRPLKFDVVAIDDLDRVVDELERTLLPGVRMLRDFVLGP